MNYSQTAYEYCQLALADNLPNRKTSLLERLAYKRHLDDLAKQDNPDFPYYFDENAANIRCAFTEALPHTKGKWRGKPFVLEPHQIFIDCSLFGWKKKSDGMRRFNRAYIAIPRKNGKSATSATTGLYMAFADNEQGAEVYAGATTESQAMMVFQPAWEMVRLTPDFAAYYGVELTGTPKNPTSVFVAEDMSRFMPIVGKPGDGASPHAAIVDEYHEHATSVLFDAMDTGMGARDQPLLLVITTAGSDTSAPCYEMELEAIKILEGTLQKDNVFVIKFGIDKEDSYEDFEVWKKANPNYGVSINEDYLRGKYNDAMTNLSQRNILLTKHLNIWMNAGQAWMDMQKWELCKRPQLELEDFYGRECYVSLDLASKIDLAALVFLFELEPIKYATCPRCQSKVIWENDRNKCSSEACSWERKTNKRVACFGKYYIPEETAHKKENQHYQLWEKEGILTVTDGARTDFQRIENDLKDIAKNVIIKELPFDPKEASYLIQNIETWANFECTEFPQGPALISEPMKELEAMVYDGCFLHDGNKVMTWMMGNVIKKQSRTGGSVKCYFPTKQNDSLKIDGPVAAIMALGRMMVQTDDGDSYNARAKAGEQEILRVI